MKLNDILVKLVYLLLIKRQLLQHSVASKVDHRLLDGIDQDVCLSDATVQRDLGRVTSDRRRKSIYYLRGGE